MRKFMEKLSKKDRWIGGIVLAVLYICSEKWPYPLNYVAGIVFAAAFLAFVILCILCKSSDKIAEEQRREQLIRDKQAENERLQAEADKKRAEIAELQAREVELLRKRVEIAELQARELELHRNCQPQIAEEAERVQSTNADLEPQAQAYVKQENKNLQSDTTDVRALVLDNLPKVDISISEVEAKKRSVSEVADIGFSNITKKTPRSKLGNFVVFDTETTGLSPAQAEIVEISAIRFRNFEPVEAFTTLCRPKKGISEEAAKINGINAEMVADKPTFGQVALAFQNFIGSDNLVAHNLQFDLKFIVKHGVDVTAENRKYYDTLYIAQHTLKKARQKWDKELGCHMTDYDSDYDVENYKLGTLCYYYGIPLYGAHRALADCLATGLLFKHLAKDRE